MARSQFCKTCCTGEGLCLARHASRVFSLVGGVILGYLIHTSSPAPAVNSRINSSYAHVSSSHFM